MPMARALLLELLSTNFCVAINVWLPIVTPAVLQLNVRVALAPAASPATVSVPTTGPLAPPSVRTTSRLLAMSCPPTFCTVTTTGTVSPMVTWPGAEMLARATSAGVITTVTVVERWLLAAF